MSQVILITGTSSGIGHSIASHLNQLGFTVYGTSRQVVDSQFPWKMVTMDVTDRTSVQKAVDLIMAKEGNIDVLVNNAGMGIGGSIERCSTEEFHRQMDVNFFGIVNVTQAILPAMRSRKSGKIINFSSVGGLMGLPFQGYYSASKFAVEGFSEALVMELKPFGIQVAVVNPGDFRTGFTASRITAQAEDEESPYKDYYKKALAAIEKDENGGEDPVLVAKLVEKIIRSKHPKFRNLVGRFDQRLMARIKPILPHKLVEWILLDHYKMRGRK